MNEDYLRARFTLAAAFLALLALPGWLKAVTDTPSPSPTATVTPTVTPGEGSLLVTPTTLVSGSGGNSMQLTYQSGPSAWSPSGGLLNIYFPLGLGTPSSANFYVQPTQANYVAAYGFNGQTASVQVNGLPANSAITFWYGYNPGGVFVSSTHATEAFTAFAYPQSDVLGFGGQIGTTPAVLSIVTATQTPTVTQTSTITVTSTISQTFTITATFSISPTFTITPTFTVSPTNTPIGKEESGVYSYPNPFDMRKFDKCTFRFPADLDARVTVFNLAGEPVRELSSSEIRGNEGWAIWDGVDDLSRKVSGGIYYVRIKGKNTLVKKFTVFH